MFETLIITALFGVFMQPALSSSETCIGEFCLTVPSEMKNFDDARSWCLANNSALVTINATGIQMAVSQFLNSLKIDSQMFINMKLSQRSGSTWYLVNGPNYNGNVNNQDYSAYKLYSFLTPRTNGGINEFLVEASKPSALRNNLCEFEGTRCQSNSTSNLLFNNRCYVKYDNENLTWYKARERCIDNGGDIAQFQSGSNYYTPPFNTSWLNQSLSYWAGIRWNGWSWKYSGDTNEVIYTSWSDGEPSNVNYACVCVDAKGSPPWSWRNCDCATTRPFACLKTYIMHGHYVKLYNSFSAVVPTTTVTTTTSTSTTTTSTSTTSPTIPTTATTLNTIQALSDKSEGLIIGLVLGLGGILPLAIVTVAVIVCNVRLRRRLRENDRNDERATTTAKTPEVNVERRPAKENAPEPVISYQYCKRDTMLGSDNGIPLYDQISQPEKEDYYELTP